MFRFSFTSGIDDIPLAAVDWVDFECDQDQQHRVCSIGRISASEWYTGPKQNSRLKQFLPLAQNFPSRYCLAYDNLGLGWIPCAFICLDPERIGENLNDDLCQDFGDNQFPHFHGTSSTVRAYLDSLNDDGDDDVSHLGFIPECIEQFLTSNNI